MLQWILSGNAVSGFDGDIVIDESRYCAGNDGCMVEYTMISIWMVKLSNCCSVSGLEIA